MRRNFFIILSLFCVLLSSVLQMCFYWGDTVYSSGLMRLNLFLACFSVILFFAMRERSEALRGQGLRAIYLLLIGFLVVHFQIYFDVEFGNYGLFGRDYVISRANLNKAVLISLAGLVSLIIGYVMVQSDNAFEVRREKVTLLSKKVPLLLGVINLIFFVSFLVTTDESYFFGGYSDVERSYLSLQSEYFLFISISATIVAASYIVRSYEWNLSVRGFISSVGRLTITVLTLYLALVLASGDRGPFISMAVMLFGAFFYAKKAKVNWVLLLVCVVFAAVTVTTLGFVREVQEGGFVDRFKEVRGNAIQHESDLSVLKPTHELAISVRALHASLLYVDENGYQLGLMQLNQLLNIIPGAGSAFREITNTSGANLKSAEIITSYMGSDHGLGTTVVADFYLDFSVIGVVVALFLLGFWMRTLDIKVSAEHAPSLLVWVCVLVFLSKGVYISRSTVLVLFRDIFFIYALIVGINAFLRSATGQGK